MTRCETLHLIVDSKDTVLVHANEATGSASLQVNNFPQTFVLTVKVEHIPQIEQLLTALWSMKENQAQQLAEIETQWETKQEYDLSAKF
jgi:hypothetical protein